VPFELEVGEASDVQVTRELVSFEKAGPGARTKNREADELTITNAKPTPVLFELRAPSGESGLAVIKESSPHALKNGSLVWRVTVPANGSAVLDLTTDTDR
jgi:hypothetical protein